VADSAGTTWRGRELTPSGVEDDTGDADPALARVVSAGAGPAALMAAVRGARLLVPVLAQAAGVDESGEHAVQTHVEMASVTLLASDGQRALPVFSSIESLARWDADARPVPATAARVGRAAVAERCDVVVIDVAGPASAVLRPSMVWALAQDRPWVAPHEDPFVESAVSRALAEEDDVTDHGLEEGSPAGEGVLCVALALRPGLSAGQVGDLATRLGERLAADGELRARIDGLAFRIR
jgi:hypothetical protein